MEAVPLHLKEANQFVARHHRHNLPTTGCKVAIGAAQDGKLVGVAIAGRPVSRRLDDGKTLEVLRVATDGTLNACSFLYARTAEIARLMGYQRVITYVFTWKASRLVGMSRCSESTPAPASGWACWRPPPWAQAGGWTSRSRSSCGPARRSLRCRNRRLGERYGACTIKPGVPVRA
jgi:hypothetical protein